MTMRFRDKIIDSVELRGSHVTIDWILGNYCNYACSYCWPNTNTGDSKVPPLDDTIRANISHLISEVKSIPANQGKKLIFALGGGEPTMYHDIGALLDLLNPLGEIYVITNGSRTLRWWEEHGHKFSDVIISYHAKSADYEHIANVIRILMGKTWLSVHVMIPPTRFDIATAAYRRLVDEFADQPVNVMWKLLMEEDGSLLPYTDEQRAELERLPPDRPRTPKREFDVAVYNLEDGTYYEWSHSTPKDLAGSFGGYDCYAHHQFINIDRRGRLGMHACWQHWHDRISIYDKDFVHKFKLSNDAITCEKDWCGCLGLYQTKKTRIADPSLRPQRDQSFVRWNESDWGQT